MNLIQPIGESIDLATGGGKAVNLSILHGEGFNVPDGFILTTESYREYVEHNNLGAIIRNEIEEAVDLESIDQASRRIREAFRAGEIPEAIKNEIKEAYSSLGSNQVAVRSSATAEDLPETSFAGQQDTFLEVGEDTFNQSIIECWSSLWTPRAIGYRNRNNIDHLYVSLAVVVQNMVKSETSGVLFTANPLTGNRTETVIDATFGLGEALVSGQVEPDNYVIDSRTGDVKSFHIGSKGGNSDQALTDEKVDELTKTGLHIQELYGTPQDIEWAFTGDELHILQSRPVTGLFPSLENVPIIPFTVYGSFSHIQGVMAPITPMGCDLLRHLIISHGQWVGSDLDLNQSTFLVPAGGRLYTNVTGPIQNKKYHQVLETALGGVEPQMKDLFLELKDDPRIKSVDQMPSIGVLFKIARVMVPLISRDIYAILTPESSREKCNRFIDWRLKSWQSIRSNASTPTEHIDIINQIFKEMPKAIINSILPKVVAGIGSFMLLKLRTESVGMGNEALNIARGIPHNVTTEMDLLIWEKVKHIKGDPDSVEALQSPVEKLVQSYMKKTLPHTLQSELEDFLNRYGMRGVNEIDVGAPRWEDDPTHIIQTMQSYLDIPDDKAPDVMFRVGSKSGDESRRKIVDAARKRGRFFGWTTSVLANAQRNLGGLRETPKFFIIRILHMMRKSLLAIGEHMVSIGILDNSSDVFYLRFSELTNVMESRAPQHELVDERKTVYERETMRRQVPRVITSEGDVYYNSKQSYDSGISGSPVSPGTVEGKVRVLLTPTSDKLNPGEILVCPATDPSWTPLFLAAGGLVMEVGGLMTHGSVVAREYGIPAVVGVRDATTRLETGQRIRVDGETGVISLLGETTKSE